MTAPPKTHAAAKPKRPFFAHMLRIFAIPIIIFWVVLTIAVNTLVPQLEVISEQHSAPLAPLDAPSMIAADRVGKNFQEYKSNSTVMGCYEVAPFYHE